MKSQEFLHIWRQGEEALYTWATLWTMEELGEAVEIIAGREGTCDACRDGLWVKGT